MCQEHHWSSVLIFFFFAVRFVKIKSVLSIGKKWGAKSPNKTPARLKNIILFSQHSFVWVFHFSSCPKQEEIMFVHRFSSAGCFTRAKPACLIRAMRIRRKQFERDPWWHNAQRQCVKPVRLQTKSVCWCAFTHTNITEAYCPSCKKTAEWAEDCGCVKHEISDRTVWFWKDYNWWSKCFKC